jgi:hypothetical protein
MSSEAVNGSYLLLKGIGVSKTIIKVTMQPIIQDKQPKTRTQGKNPRKAKSSQDNKASVEASVEGQVKTMVNIYS